MQDAEIVALLFARSEQSLQELDRKYGPLCRQLSGRFLVDRRDVEECVNDAWLAVWNAVPPARPDSLRAFLCKVVRNLSLKRNEENRAAKRDRIHEVAMEELQECLPSSHFVETRLEARGLAHTLETFLDTLDRENRVIFLRRYWFSDSYRDIAHLTGLSEKNISVRLTRTRKQLKRYLQEREVFS